MGDIEEPPWSARACELLVAEPELGYRTLHDRLQQEGFNVGWKKIQKFASTWHTQHESPAASQKPLDAQTAISTADKRLSALVKENPCWRSTLGCFELMPIEGKGLGAFATCDLKCGDLIVEEAPALEYDHDVAEMANFLSACGGSDPSAVPSFIRSQWNQLPDDTRAEIMELHDCHGSEKSLLGILKTNVLARGADSTGSVLCPTISRFNHSCSPNCQHSWDEDAKVERLMACTDIKHGSELCTYYTQILKQKAERQRELQVRYGFLCACEACCSSNTSSDRRRAKMAELDQLILQVGARDQKKGLSMVQDLLDKYDEEGIHNQSLRARACYDAFQLALPLRDLRSAKKWIEKSHMHFALGEGPENPNAKRMLAFVHDPKSHRNWQ